MYIITFRDHEQTLVNCVVTNNTAVYALASLLESKEKRFKVEGPSVTYLPGHFGFGTFHYWLNSGHTL